MPATPVSTHLSGHPVIRTSTHEDHSPNNYSWTCSPIKPRGKPRWKIGIGLSSASLAQSLTAPAGIPAITAPGGVQGRTMVADPRTSPGDGRAGIIDADGKPQTTGSVGHRRGPHSDG